MGGNTKFKVNHKQCFTYMLDFPNLPDTPNIKYYSCTFIMCDVIHSMAIVTYIMCVVLGLRPALATQNNATRTFTQATSHPHTWVDACDQTPKSTATKDRRRFCKRGQDHRYVFKLYKLLSYI